MKRQFLNNERGSVLLFVTVTMIMLLAFGGMAIDLTYFGSVRRELQRSMDSAALAGAGNLGFNTTAFPAARAAAQNYAGLNGYSDPSKPTINLNLNTANNPGGDIVLGIWNNGTFTPSLNGTQVNAVQCQFATTIPTSFLRVLGVTNLGVTAQAIAVTDPPILPDTSCVGPFALSDCFFRSGGTPGSQGCGAPITFISSSGNPGSTNTAAWANLCGTSTPSAPQTQAVINGLASGNCNAGCPLPQAGSSTQIGTNNGMQQSVFDALENAFVANFNPSVTHQVVDSGGNTTYSGPGWKMYVPVIDTGSTCPPGPISGPKTLTGWSEMVVTQTYDRNNGCSVSNPADTYSASVCATTNPNLRAVYGYYNCTKIPSLPNPNPAPTTALATNLRLVR